MADRDDYEPDEQDQSEVFDEDNFDTADAGSETNEFKTLEEIPDVFDVTSAVGDSGDEDDLDPDEVLALEGIEPTSEDRDDGEAAAFDDGPETDARSSEVDLVYTGLMRNVKGAQASAAHWEARRLSEDDLDALGYQGQEPAK